MSNPFLVAFLGGEPAPSTAGLLALEFGSGVFIPIGSLASEVISMARGLGSCSGGGEAGGSGGELLGV